MLKCTLCDVPVAECQCPDIDARLKKTLFVPGCQVAVKWCRTCDKHYGRCKCPDDKLNFVLMLGGKQLDQTAFRNAEGGVTVPNLKAR